MIKRLIKTKTFWTGLAGILGGVGLIVTGNPTEGIGAILVSIQTINLRDALAKK